MILEKHIDVIVNYILDNEELVIYDYNGKTNQILITKKLVLGVDKILSEITDVNEDPTTLLKYAIRKSFELSMRDLVIRKNGNIFIKLLSEVSQVEIQEEDKGTIANRYEGIAIEELEAFNEEFFADKGNKYFFANIAKEFVQTYFIENKIGNVNYEKNVFSNIKSIVVAHLIAMYDNSDGFFDGFAGYIFRIHFKEVFEYIADIILDEISMSNGYMMEFLKYYSSDILVINNIKYRVPNIEAKNGLRWSAVSMLSIAKIYTKSTKTIKEILKKIKILDEEASIFLVDDLTPLEQHSQFLRDTNDLNEELDELKQQLSIYVDSYNIVSNEEERKALKSDMIKLKEFIQEVRDEKSALKPVKSSKIQAYTKIKKEYDSMQRYLNREKKLIAQNRDSYLSMRDSLVVALTSKKQPI